MVAMADAGDEPPTVGCGAEGPVVVAVVVVAVLVEGAVGPARRGAVTLPPGAVERRWRGATVGAVRARLDEHPHVPAPLATAAMTASSASTRRTAAAPGSKRDRRTVLSLRIGITWSRSPLRVSPTKNQVPSRGGSTCPVSPGPPRGWPVPVHSAPMGRAPGDG